MSNGNEKRDAAIKRTVKKRNKRRRRRLLSLLFTVLFLLLCAAAVLAVTVLFPIKNIVVDGGSIYGKDEIIKASEILEGDNIIILSSEKAANRISKTLPKSGDITIKKQLPDTVKITVKNAVPTYYFILDGAYYIADKNLKVIEISGEQPSGCILIKLKEFPEIAEGEIVSLSEESSNLFDKLLSICKDKQIEVTGIDISDTVSLKIVVEDRLLVQLGVDLDTEYKIAHLAAMLPKMDADDMGTVDLKNWSENNTKASFRDEKLNTSDFFVAE